MIINQIYEVERPDYESFVRRLIGGFGRLEREETDEYELIYIVSKRTDKIWCARKSFKNGEPEQYFIVDYPDRDEWTAAQPTHQVVLDTPEQVQTLLDALKKRREENERIVSSGASRAEEENQTSN